MPPHLSDPVPANLSTVSEPRPRVGLSIDENGPGTRQVRIQLSLDSAVVFDAWVDEGAFTWTPPTDFANNSTHNVTALVTDAAGNSSALIWSFSVVAAPPMYVGGACNRAGCHVAFPDAHVMSPCTSCHSYGWMTDVGPRGTGRRSGVHRRASRPCRSLH